MGRTMFAADAALDSLLASSSPEAGRPARPETQAPVKAPRPAAKAARRPKQLPASPQGDPSERQQLNVALDSDLFAAINLRKTRSKLAGDKDEDSYCKIVELALKKHLANEIDLVSMMKG